MSKQASKPTTAAKLRANTSSDMSPKSTKKNKPIFLYICALCNRGFTRKSTVKDPHFASCVRRNGNPNNVAWDDHPSCFTRLPDGSLGPSGEIPSGLAAALKRKGAVSSTPNAGSTKESGGDPSNHDDTLGAFWESEEDWEGADSSVMEIPKEQDRLGTLPMFAGSPIHENQRTCTRPGNPPAFDVLPLSSLVMNQLASVVIGATAKRAAIGHEDALEMWMLWHDLLPEGYATRVKAPQSSFTASQRRQAVVWLAQDVYAADLEQIKTLHDELAMVLRERDILFSLKDMEALSAMEKLLLAAPK